tara:strand:+ start:41583 stop:45314 length:3732 start_codon:yes stop_codon:yes gene_type:complete
MTESIDQRRLTITLSLSLIATVTLGIANPRESVSAEPRPNVLVIVTDEHNFRTLGCYRQLMPAEQAEMWGEGVVVPTPHIDAIAKAGVICTRAYATSPVCSPCRAAMITGRYPHAVGMPTNNLVLDRSVPTLADRLNDAGYRTGFIGKWHLGGAGRPDWSPKVDGGFQFKKFMFNRGHWKKFVINDGEPAVGSTKNGEPSSDVDGADEKSFSTDFLTDRAIEFMTDPQQIETPFFATLSYPDPHGPNTVRAPYDHRFDDLRFTAPRTYNTGIPSPKWMSSASNHPIFRGDDMSRYFGMVQCIDDNIGRLVRRLDESGQLDNTLFVLTSDHGDLCYEHDRQNKGNPYEGSARVPMIWKHPALIPGNQVYDQPMGTVDITPTLMGLLGHAANDDDQGRNLADAFGGNPSTDHNDDDPPVTFLRNSGTRANWVAAVDERYKLILSVNDRPWLFDKEQDPDELLNFYRRPGTEGVAERLAKALRDYGQQNEDPYLDNPAISHSLASVLGEKPEIENDASRGYHSKWKGSRLWVGPDWWANPMTDWSLRGDAAVAAAAGNRTLCLLSADIGSEGSGFQAQVEIASLGPKGPKEKSRVEKAGKTAAGFRFGRQGGIDDYRHRLVHATDWIDATIDDQGRLHLADQVSPSGLSHTDDPITEPITLRLTGTQQGDTYQLQLTATRGEHSSSVTASVARARVSGGLSLLSDGPSQNGGSSTARRYAFRDFSLSGDAVTLHDDRQFGPILWSQYTLSRNQLRMQAQFAPLGPRQKHEAELWIAPAAAKPRTNWTQVDTQPMDSLSRTVAFVVDDWDSSTEYDYQVRFAWRGKKYTWDGKVRREPTSSDAFRLGCFSCDNGYLFPIPSMVAQVTEQDPDMMFFAGDQIYESYGGFGVARGADVEPAMIDYLRKFYQFGWTWRDLMRDRPTVLLPDDHDVFQGNLWGHGGRELPYESGKPDWALGGYLMPGPWVSAVEKTHVGHLPPPTDDVTLPIGIKPYYTDMVYGGVGFAILEDRKFKTGPKSMPEPARPEAKDADLLGEAQEKFLSDWSDNWDGHSMKCVLSQTIFCTAATHTGPNLKRTRSYFDSGAWPKPARNRAVRIMGDCNALAIHGDQHLGILLRHGVDDFDDAGYAFMVPGTANGFPRAWWPGEKTSTPDPGKDYTGKFHDDAGHPIHVLAVGNPEPGSNILAKTKNPAEVGYRKGSGYGLVEFDVDSGDATINLYRYGGNGEQFDGFPQTIHIGGSPTNDSGAP